MIASTTPSPRSGGPFASCRATSPRAPGWRASRRRAGTSPPRRAFSAAWSTGSRRRSTRSCSATSSCARAGRPRRDAAYALVERLERLLEANGVRTDLQTAVFDLDRGVTVGDALDRARAAYRSAPGLAAADAVAWGLYRAGRCADARAGRATRSGSARRTASSSSIAA